MNDKIILGLLVVAGFVGTIITAPVLATTIESFLVIESARVTADHGELSVRLNTGGEIFQPMEAKEHLVMEFVQTMEMLYWFLQHMQEY